MLWAAELLAAELWAGAALPVMKRHSAHSTRSSHSLTGPTSVEVLALPSLVSCVPIRPFGLVAAAFSSTVVPSFAFRLFAILLGF